MPETPSIIEDLKALIENENADIAEAEYDHDACSECGFTEALHEDTDRSDASGHAFESEHDSIIRQRGERVERVAGFVEMLERAEFYYKLAVTPGQV